MEKNEIFTIEELNAAVCAAVNAALDARDAARKNVMLSRKAVAKRLHVNASTLWRWNRDGYFRGIKIGGRMWYSEEAVEALEKGRLTA